jgi:hypothetical protein
MTFEYIAQVVGSTVIFASTFWFLAFSAIVVSNWLIKRWLLYQSLWMAFIEFLVERRKKSQP